MEPTTVTDTTVGQGNEIDTAARRELRISMPDPQLQRQTSSFATSGGRFLAFGVSGALVGAVIFLIGLAVAYWLEIAGIAIAVVFALGAMVGLGLLLSAAVTGWASRHRPFA
jgi:hypothetical protein